MATERENQLLLSPKVNKKEADVKELNVDIEKSPQYHVLSNYKKKYSGDRVNPNAMTMPEFKVFSTQDSSLNDLKNNRAYQLRKQAINQVPIYPDAQFLLFSRKENLSSQALDTLRDNARFKNLLTND